MLILRPYQIDALDALDAHLREHKYTSSCVTIPTGGGKSLIIAHFIKRLQTQFPALRVCILQHRKELVRQNSDEMIGTMPDCDLGIYAAGLKRYDTNHAILYASIDSIYKKCGELEPFDLIIVDEAHRIPLKGEGKYRKFIKGCRRTNPKLKLVGFTATPFRMDGPVCHEDHMLQKMIYEAHVSDLIDDGYLCNLRTRSSEFKADLSNIRKASGDYVIKALSDELDTEEIVQEAVKELVNLINVEERKSVIVFAITIKHCKHIIEELRKHSISADYVNAKTSPVDRDRIVDDFKKGRIRVLVNINVYTEGFNAKQVDCIALLRPTLSKGLYVQMVGRGLRTHPNKIDCLILDFSNCIEEHGPIDLLKKYEVRMVKCRKCGDSFNHILGKCPNIKCNWVIPPKEQKELAESSDSERRMHEKKAAANDILTKPKWMAVSEVKLHRKKKAGEPDALRIQFICGSRCVSIISLINDKGEDGKNARKRWNDKVIGTVTTVDDALNDTQLSKRIKKRISHILVKDLGNKLILKKCDINILN
jgi:DNA repair protein RadD